MDKNSNSFTVFFAVAVCVVLATALAATYNGLKSTIDANAAFDKKINVLIAMGFYEKGDVSVSRTDLEKLYEERVQGKVLEVLREKRMETVYRDSKRVEEEVERVADLVETEHDIADLAALQFAEGKKAAAERREYVAIYRGTDEQGAAVWCIPISCRGLWSTLLGFLALESDLNTVRGITFYSHKETPGLGGEVDNVSWQEQWRGKTILDEAGQIIGITVKKGIVDAKVAFEKAHMVDGLAGATITANGVTDDTLTGLETYEPYFAKHRQ